MPILGVHLKHPDVTAEHLGLIPYMLNSFNPASASEQFDAEYQHGGGWRPLKGWVLHKDDSIEYKPNEEDSDPPLLPLAEIHWGRDERVLIYDYGWVAIIQPDGAFEVARMD